MSAGSLLDRRTPKSGAGTARYHVRMPDVQLFDFAESEWEQGYAAPFCSVSGECHAKTAKLMNYSLWTIMGRLATGTSIRWSGAHGDEVVMPLTGSLTV